MEGVDLESMSAGRSNLTSMKTLLALVLVILLIAIAMPMGMGEMGDCPMCTSPKTTALGTCAGILSLIALILVLGSSLFRSREELMHALLVPSSVYRPPRFS